MKRCRLVILLAISIASCSIASRVSGEDEDLLTARKCCKATGTVQADKFEAAATLRVNLKKANINELQPLQAEFYNKHCAQGSSHTTSLSTQCKKKDYTFDQFTIKISKMETVDPADCPNEWLHRCNEEAAWTPLAGLWRCPVDPRDRTQEVFEECKSKPTVAIFADYDACWDIISAANPLANEGNWAIHYTTPYKDVSGVLRKKIEEIAQGKRVILFVGDPERQAWQEDATRARLRANGLALGANNSFEHWVREFRTDYGGCWNLNKALLSDVAPCSSWSEKWNSESLGMRSKGELMTMILENGMKQLLLEDHVDLYYYSSNALDLEHVRLNAKIPTNMRLSTIHYSWNALGNAEATKPLEEISVS